MDTLLVRSGTAHWRSIPLPYPLAKSLLMRYHYENIRVMRGVHHGKVYEEG